jgi:hypothetical protein
MAGLGSLNHAQPGSRARARYGVLHRDGRLAALTRESRAMHDMIARYGDLLLAQVQQLIACNSIHDVPSRLVR